MSAAFEDASEGRAAAWVGRMRRPVVGKSASGRLNVKEMTDGFCFRARGDGKHFGELRVVVLGFRHGSVPAWREMMEHDAQAICGPRHARGHFRWAHRWEKQKAKSASRRQCRDRATKASSEAMALGLDGDALERGGHARSG